MERDWRIWIYQGIDFTDCLAVGRSGSVYRTRVAGNGSLKGKIIRILDGGWMIVEQQWGIPSNVLKGYNFKFVDLFPDKFKVLAYDPERSALQIASKPGKELEGEQFEIGSGEEASALAVRLATSRLINDNLLPANTIRIPLRKNGEPDKGLNVLLIVSQSKAPDSAEAPFLFKPAGKREWFDHKVEAFEQPDSSGSAIAALAESEINRLMREVFRIKPGVIFISLTHSKMNPLNERTLLHLLKAAGYRHVVISNEF